MKLHQDQQERRQLIDNFKLCIEAGNVISSYTVKDMTRGIQNFSEHKSGSRSAKLPSGVNVKLFAKYGIVLHFYQGWTANEEGDEWARVSPIDCAYYLGRTMSKQKDIIADAGVTSHFESANAGNAIMSEYHSNIFCKMHGLTPIDHDALHKYGFPNNIFLSRYGYSSSIWCDYIVSQYLYVMPMIPVEVPAHGVGVLRWKPKE